MGFWDEVWPLLFSLIERLSSGLVFNIPGTVQAEAFELNDNRYAVRIVSMSNTAARQKSAPWSRHHRNCNPPYIAHYNLSTYNQPFLCCNCYYIGFSEQKGRRETWYGHFEYILWRVIRYSVLLAKSRSLAPDESSLQSSTHNVLAA